MNDEASSSRIARPPPSIVDSNGSSYQPAPTAAELAERRKKNRQTFNRKRGDLLDDLLRNLDLIIYAELSAIYYMDCSFLRFVLRAFVQFLLLTPKPPVFPEQPEDRPVVGAIFTTNAICLFCHIYFAAPSAGEATRGFLHGGLAMDFIGQQGPSSKIHLVLLDILVVVLQLVLLAAGTLRKRLKDKASSATPASTSTTPSTNTAAAPTTTTTAPAAPATQPSTQDLDSEERGVRRSMEQHDIEMQTLNPSGTATSPAASIAEPSAHDALLANTSAPATDEHIFDAFHSGQIVLADLDIWKTIKEQASMMKDSRNASTPTVDSIRSELAARMLRMRMGTDALRQSL
ncbi:hypothetical protein BDY17DRAFT_324650 [Neohortaea acidophila]|uniref:DUF1746 domain-containing protein n=1 Tax=Neohortaea acidophila TaxID=245834 RepID=A0A6A6PSA0_9PEZI|nr:uncharacterized protein BDY17DRAFT_324650 [Neohortaea acidophila]KAF2482363.1 hypothetical protein BDY17DRAFT_324650 [Neohortaea acidophila]